MTDVDIVEFLTQRYQEIENRARAAAKLGAGKDWTEGDRPGAKWQAHGSTGISFGPVADFWFEVDYRHALLHDPARVLADLAAKRAIVKLYREERGLLAARGHNAEGESRLWLLEAVLARLTTPYADHPDFDPAWKIAGAST